MAELREGDEGVNGFENLVEDAIRRGQTIVSNELPDFIEVC
jgi:hypothetical protein